MQTRRSLLGQAAAALLAADCRAQPATGDYDSLFDDFYARVPVVGLQGAIVEQGVVRWSRAAGFSDAERRIAMDADTAMNIASVTKTITAAAVLLLTERERIHLDSDISAYLPFAVRNPFHPKEPITARHLLTHTSSIADGPAYGRSYACSTDVPGLREWLVSFCADGHNYSPWSPGTNFSYSNVGFGLLGLMVETVSGQAFAAFCEREVFVPLAMRNSAVGTPKRRAAVDYTLGMPESSGRVMGNGRPLGVRGRTYSANCAYSFPTAPDGLLYTSANDFARFVAAMLATISNPGHSLLRPETLASIFREQFPKAGRPAPFPLMQGLCWYAVSAPDGAQVWMHSGADPGVRTIAMLHRPTSSGVVLFANTAPADGLNEAAGALLRRAARRH
jgi:Beta-lactamase class C and other penicillin binding proteins